MRPDTDHSLCCVAELGHASAAESLWWRKYCPDPDREYDRLCLEASNLTDSRSDDVKFNAHYLHMFTLSTLISDRAHAGRLELPQRKLVFTSLNDITRGFRMVKEVIEIKEIKSESELTDGCQSIDLAIDSDREYETIRDRLIRSFRLSIESLNDAPDDMVKAAIKKYISSNRTRSLSIRFKKIRKEQKQHRKAFLQSYRILKSFIGDFQMQNMLKTRKLFIKGTDYDFRVNLPERIVGVGSHNPRGLTVLAKDGTEISEMCIFSEDAPLLDHIVSLVAHIKSGEEKLLFEKGNLFNVRDGMEKIANQIDGFDRPLVAKEQLDQVLANRLTVTFEDFEPIPEEEKQRRKESILNSLPSLNCRVQETLESAIRQFNADQPRLPFLIG